MLHGQVVAKVERDLMAILDGAAPEGVKFVDVEEEFVVDPATGVGSWRKASTVAAGHPAAAATAGGQPKASGGGGGAGKAGLGAGSETI